MSLEAELHRLEKNPEDFLPLLRAYRRLGVRNWLERCLDLRRRPRWDVVKDYEPEEMEVPFHVYLGYADISTMLPEAYLGIPYLQSHPYIVSDIVSDIVSERMYHPLEAVRRLRDYYFLHPSPRLPILDSTLSRVTTRRWWKEKESVADFPFWEIPTFREGSVLSREWGDPEGISREKPSLAYITQTGIHFGVKIKQGLSFKESKDRALCCFTIQPGNAQSLPVSDVVRWMNVYRSWVCDGCREVRF